MRVSCHPGASHEGFRINVGKSVIPRPVHARATCFEGTIKAFLFLREGWRAYAYANRVCEFSWVGTRWGARAYKAPYAPPRAPCDPLPQGAVHASQQQALTDINEFLLNTNQARALDAIKAYLDALPAFIDAVRVTSYESAVKRGKRTYRWPPGTGKTRLFNAAATTIWLYA
ncbi:hypothetical protein BC940DRAFT_314633 [Gongronella butleri]|nr:hypothetical protein BC940DRAFT_314633 [Gongronella butleri]